VANVFKALNDFPEWRPGADPSPGLEREHLSNEEAAVRLVALTVETRPDYIDEGEVDFLLRLGVTMVEMGCSLSTTTCWRGWVGATARPRWCGRRRC